MSRRFRVFACLFFAACVLMAGNAEARYPSYSLLIRSHGHSVHSRHPAYGVAHDQPTYSYGWFGAQPRSRASVYGSYYGNYFDLRY